MTQKTPASTVQQNGGGEVGQPTRTTSPFLTFCGLSQNENDDDDDDPFFGLDSEGRREEDDDDDRDDRKRRNSRNRKSKDRHEEESSHRRKHKDGDDRRKDKGRKNKSRNKNNNGGGGAADANNKQPSWPTDWIQTNPILASVRSLQDAVRAGEAVGAAEHGDNAEAAEAENNNNSAPFPQRIPGGVMNDLNSYESMSWTANTTVDGNAKADGSTQLTRETSETTSPDYYVGDDDVDDVEDILGETTNNPVDTSNDYTNNTADTSALLDEFVNDLSNDDEVVSPNPSAASRHNDPSNAFTLSDALTSPPILLDGDLDADPSERPNHHPLDASGHTTGGGTDALPSVPYGGAGAVGGAVVAVGPNLAKDKYEVPHAVGQSYSVEDDSTLMMNVPVSGPTEEFGTTPAGWNDEEAMEFRGYKVVGVIPFEGAGAGADADADADADGDAGQQLQRDGGHLDGDGFPLLAAKKLDGSGGDDDGGGGTLGDDADRQQQHLVAPSSLGGVRTKKWDKKAFLTRNKMKKDKKSEERKKEQQQQQRLRQHDEVFGIAPPASPAPDAAPADEAAAAAAVRSAKRSSRVGVYYTGGIEEEEKKKERDEDENGDVGIFGSGTPTTPVFAAPDDDNDGDDADDADGAGYETGEEVTFDRAVRTRSAILSEASRDEARDRAWREQLEMSSQHSRLVSEAEGGALFGDDYDDDGISYRGDDNDRRHLIDNISAIERDASRLEKVTDLLDRAYGDGDGISRERSDLRASRVLEKYEGKEDMLIEVLEEKARATGGKADRRHKKHIRRPSWGGRSLGGSIRSFVSSARSVSSGTNKDDDTDDERSSASSRWRAIGGRSQSRRAGREAAAAAAAAVAVSAINSTATKQAGEATGDSSSGQEATKNKKGMLLRGLKNRVSKKMNNRTVTTKVISSEIGPKRAEVRMISGCQDAQTSSDVQNISAFQLPDPAGRSGGACTSALLKVLYSDHRKPKKDLSFVAVLDKMRVELSREGYAQIPQLTASEPINVRAPFRLVQAAEEAAKAAEAAGGRGGDRPPTARALLIGINYKGQRGELSGCHNDVNNMKGYLMDVHGFEEGDISILMDDGKHPLPTRSNILAAYRQLVKESRAGDSVFCHYSGHGGKVRDDDGNEEEDGYDETICPLDFDDAGQIRDDDIYETLVRPMPAGVMVTCLMDSCHSGTVLDLPYKLKGDGSRAKEMMLAGGGSVGPGKSLGKVSLYDDSQDLSPRKEARTNNAASKPSSPSTFLTAQVVSDSEDELSEDSTDIQIKQFHAEAERLVENKLSYAVSFDSAPGMGAAEVTSFGGVAKFEDMPVDDVPLQEDELQPNERERTPSFIATPRVDPVAVGLLPNTDKIDDDEAFEVDLDNKVLSSASGVIPLSDYYGEQEFSSDESEEDEELRAGNSLISGKKGKRFGRFASLRRSKIK